MRSLLLLFVVCACASGGKPTTTDIESLIRVFPENQKPECAYQRAGVIRFTRNEEGELQKIFPLLTRELKRRAWGLHADAVIDAQFAASVPRVRVNGVDEDPKFFGIKQEQTVVGTAIKYDSRDCMR